MFQSDNWGTSYSVQHSALFFFLINQAFSISIWTIPTGCFERNKHSRTNRK